MTLDTIIGVGVLLIAGAIVGYMLMNGRRK